MKKRNLITILLAVLVLIFFIGTYGIHSLNGRDMLNITKITTPHSYDELYSLLKRKTFSSKNNLFKDESFGAVSSASSIKKEYSKTNVQVSGIDEADIVKTDGNYIYYLANDYLNIIEVKDDVMNIKSKIKATSQSNDSYSSYSEIYIYDNKLIVIKNNDSNGIYRDMIRIDYIENTETSAVIFDITDKSNPIKINELSQSGRYVSSRLIDNYLYLVTNHYIYGDIIRSETDTFVPRLRVESSKLMLPEDLLIVPQTEYNSYIILTGIDINNSNNHISSKAVLGASSNIYADINNIYVISNSYRNFSSNEKTNILKFSMKNGKLNLDATGEVKGNILNQFSMDEYNGYFRIVTTHNDFNRFIIDQILRPDDTETTTNNLYILDSNLNKVGQIEGLAKGERIYSVRFDEDISYFVTFKQVDPLFVVDVSNPKEPIIKTELKIPGFSEYLHVYDDKYLFGLGKEADLDGRVTGLKISMFNIEDKTNVTENYKELVAKNAWSEASHNHKAIIISKERNLIGFPLDSKYVVYKFTDNVGFDKIIDIDFKANYYGNSRGLYIDDYFYILNGNTIKTINLNTKLEGNFLEINK